MPKVRSKGVADGHPVNIPEPLEGSEGGTQRNSRVRGWLSGFKAVRGPGRQIHQVGSQPPLKAEYDGLRPYKVGDSRCQEKPLRASPSGGAIPATTVPQTDTGRRGEYPQALERTLAQELGKLAP